MHNDQSEQFFLPTLGLASTGMSKGGKMSLGSGGRGPFNIVEIKMTMTSRLQTFQYYQEMRMRMGKYPANLSTSSLASELRGELSSGSNVLPALVLAVYSSRKHTRTSLDLKE